MSYGLRQYETFHRLFWFAFFILCLFLAWYSQGSFRAAQPGPELKDVRKIDFWTGLKGIRITSPATDRAKSKQGQSSSSATPVPGKSTAPSPKKEPAAPPAEQDDLQDNIQLIGGTLLFLIAAGIIFLKLRLLWLVVQYAGRYLLQLVMLNAKSSAHSKPELAGTGPDSQFPGPMLIDKIRRNPMSFFLHPFIRLRLMLSGFHKNVPSEALIEKERRAVDADWQILYNSWMPYRCLFWILPLLGLAQTALLLIAQFNIASSGLASLPASGAAEAAKPLLSLTPQKEILEAVKPTLNLLLPLIQAAGLAIFFQLASTLMRYLEELYLSNLDSFIYDRLLSKLPLQSNDTVLILDALQGQFKELHMALRRLEKRLTSQTGIEK